MKSDEHEVLENFLDQLIQVRGIKKVPQADAMIRGALERQPDAAYLLVQRSLILGQALEEAKARIAELEQNQESSFFDSGISGASAPASQGTAAPERPPAYSGPSSQFPSSLPTGAPMSPEPSRGSGTGGFLGQAAATAAGVAGGAFLFEGLEHMLNHGATPLDHASQSLMPEDVTINNYYADSERPNHDEDDQSDRFADKDSADDDSASTDDDTDFV